MTEWSPWIEHDGKGCPCVGQFVHLVFGDGNEILCIAGERAKTNGIAVNGPWSAWVWGEQDPEPWEIIRYRIRKPRGMVILETLLADLPAPVKEGV